MHLLSQLLPELSVSRETLDKLDHFAALFDKWAQTINLVAPSTKEQLWRRHIADSAQLWNILPEPKQWIDLGSGGGFPGIVMAILLSQFRDGWVHLVESNQKKASFLRIALAETGARGSVHTIRIEEAPGKLEKCDVISARALADLDRLCEYSHPWMVRSSSCRALLHKGRDYVAEIAKARGRWDFDLVVHQSAIEADSVVLDVSHIAQKAQ